MPEYTRVADGIFTVAGLFTPGECDEAVAFAERIVGHLKAAGTRQLWAEGLHPFERHALADGSVPTVWAGWSWKVFLDSPEDVRRAIRYVENNPLKEGMAPQEWSFVMPYVG